MVSLSHFDQNKEKNASFHFFFFFSFVMFLPSLYSPDFSMCLAMSQKNKKYISFLGRVVFVRLFHPLQSLFPPISFANKARCTDSFHHAGQNFSHLRCLDLLMNQHPLSFFPGKAWQSHTPRPTHPSSTTNNHCMVCLPAWQGRHRQLEHQHRTISAPFQQHLGSTNGTYPKPSHSPFVSFHTLGVGGFGCLLTSVQVLRPDNHDWKRPVRSVSAVRFYFF